MTVGTPHTRNAPLKLPCLAPKGVTIFSPTADQRFLAGSDEFLRTHFPVLVHHRRASSSATLTEQDILYRLLEPGPAIVGNRVFVLYGAAGSGKSELMRWLQTQIHLKDQSRDAITIRITRTDLDLFHLAQRFKHLQSDQLFQTETFHRWEEARQKPRTLAKILVLRTLEQLLKSDDQINALYYQLIDVVQTNLERCFAAMSQPTEDIGQFIELFSREDLVEILRNSAIPISIEYETLRYHLLKTFRDQLLEGWDLSSTLKHIAQQIQLRHQRRPILFIDDLVQSINFFATDVLDYFITLEEGCWDVVVGITPNSLDATLRGKELLDRITFLDTIDDRVEKLWLSDDYGLSSSFLNEMNCTEYARLYLSEYKRQNQRPCNNQCPSFDRCHHLEPEQPDDLLAPFNREVLIRLFRSLPQGKGKVRYFTLYLRDILEHITQGEEVLSSVQRYVTPEQAVYHPDSALAQVHEFYGPFLDGESPDKVTNDISHLYQFFDVPFPTEDTQHPIVTSLYQQRPQEILSVSNPESTLDPGKQAIKAWLKGEIVNKQLLRNVRRGMVKALKSGYPVDTLTRLHTAKPMRVLRWVQTHMDTTPPVQLEGIDDFDGLPLDQTIGHFAYRLHDFADATGSLEQELRNQLLTNEAFPTILFEARAYRTHICNELENHLGMKIEEFSFSLLIVAMGFGHSPIALPPFIEQKIGLERSALPRYPESIEALRPRLTDAQLAIIRQLFEDCFKLRENVYDGVLLEQLAERIDQDHAVEVLQSIETDKLSADVRLTTESLSTFIRGVQAEIAKLRGLNGHEQVMSVLLSICTMGVGKDVTSQQFAALLGLSEDLEKSVATFINKAHPFELHRALMLAYVINIIQYENTLTQLRQIIVTRESQQSDLREEAARLSQNFTSAEIDTLHSFTRQGFHISLSQIQTDLLSKIAQYLPDLYRKLELQLQSS